MVVACGHATSLASGVGRSLRRASRIHASMAAVERYRIRGRAVRRLDGLSRIGGIPVNMHVETGVKAQTGDWLEAHGTLGKPARRGEIIEVLGEPGRAHYRVRWDAQHESI